MMQKMTYMQVSSTVSERTDVCNQRNDTCACVNAYEVRGNERSNEEAK